jgi:hypothetical protein
MTARCVRLHAYETLGHPIGCFECLMLGSGTALFETPSSAAISLTVHAWERSWRARERSATLPRLPIGTVSRPGVTTKTEEAYSPSR